MHLLMNCWVNLFIHSSFRYKSLMAISAWGYSCFALCHNLPTSCAKEWISKDSFLFGGFVRDWITIKNFQVSRHLSLHILSDNLTIKNSKNSIVICLLSLSLFWLPYSESDLIASYMVLIIIVKIHIRMLIFIVIQSQFKTSRWSLSHHDWIHNLCTKALGYTLLNRQQSIWIKMKMYIERSHLKKNAFIIVSLDLVIKYMAISRIAI